jgi:histidyl-tRNA synthetase
MRKADRCQSSYVGILGAEELQKGMVLLRNMHTKEQEEVSIENFAEKLKTKISHLYTLKTNV